MRYFKIYVTVPGNLVDFLNKTNSHTHTQKYDHWGDTKFEIVLFNLNFLYFIITV